jgi:MFS transporter, ACS family, hexuronate transporter
VCSSDLIALVYIISSIGSIGGGWLSGFLIGKGWPIFKARKTAMLFFAVCVVPIVAVQALGKMSPWFAILIIGLATAAHQAWSANIFTTSSDMFPKKAVASIVGLGGMAGALGSVVLQWVAGILLDRYKGLGHIETAYYILFIIGGSAYLTAWVVMHVLAPQMKTVNLDE